MRDLLKGKAFGGGCAGAALVFLIATSASAQVGQSRAIAGGASSPEANLFIGGSTTNIPIDLPPGRGAATPQLALTYSSSGGPSLYGYGWDLSLPKIQRATKYGALTCARPWEFDDFVLTMPGASIEFEKVGDDGRPRIEEEFVTIRHEGPNIWRVWDSEGTRYTFGGQPYSRVGTSIDILGFSVCNDGLAPSDTGTYLWALSQIRDRNGNIVDFAYEPDVGKIPRLSRIDYGGNDPSHGHVFSVTFVWSDRPDDDVLTNSIGGFPAVLTKRLDYILVRGPSTIRSYEFIYDGTDPESNPGRAGRQTFLTSVAEYSGDLEAGGVQLAFADGTPAVTSFAYEEKEPNHESKCTGGSHDGEVCDQHSDCPGGGCPSDPFGLDESVQIFPLPPWYGYGRLFVTSGDTTYALRDIIDMNGDGFLDFVDSTSANGGDPEACLAGPSAVSHWDVHLGSPAGFGERIDWIVKLPRQCVISRERRGGALGNRRVREELTIDLTGDGRADFVQVVPGYGRWDVYDAANSSNGFQGVAEAFYTESPYIMEYEPAARYGFQNGEQQTRGLLDLNGDGLLDHVVTKPSGPWDVWINNGDSFSTRRTFAGYFASLSYQAEGRRIQDVVDMNADGLVDGVFTPDATHIIVHFHQGSRIPPDSESWTIPNFAPGVYRRGLALTDPQSGEGTRLFSDINADGLPDILDNSQCDEDADDPHWTVSLNRGGGSQNRTPGTSRVHWGVRSFAPTKPVP